eukprot:Rmarinus@m.10556
MSDEARMVDARQPFHREMFVTQYYPSESSCAPELASTELRRAFMFNASIPQKPGIGSLSAVFPELTQQVGQSADHISRAAVEGLLHNILHGISESRLKELLIHLGEDESKELLDDVQNTRLGVYNNVSLGDTNHCLFRSAGCRPDVMYAATQCKQDDKDMFFPVLIIENLSEYEKNNPVLQLELKLVYQLSLMAALVRNANLDIGNPTHLKGIALPLWNIPGRFYEVTVEWDMKQLMFFSSVEEFQPNRVTLEKKICEILISNDSPNRQLLRFLRKRLAMDDALSVSCNTIYQLNHSQLEDLNKDLPGNDENSRLFQLRAKEALLFARFVEEDGIDVPQYYFKTSPGLSNVMSPKLYGLTSHSFPRVESSLVLPIRLEGTGDPVYVVRGHKFFVFPAHDSFQKGTLLTLFPQVVACVANLHKCGFMHRDIRRENFVTLRNVHKESKEVRLIDLDRVIEPPDFMQHRFVTLPWYPSDCLRENLDWYQLGVSVVRECIGHKDNLQRAVENVQSAVRKTRKNLVSEVLNLLLVKTCSPPKDPFEMPTEQLVDLAQHQDWCLEYVKTQVQDFSSDDR